MHETRLLSPRNGLPRYTGLKQPQKGEFDHNGNLVSPYIPSDELVEAVNLAIFLGRPLLVMGEPGTGKTRLAQHIAFELGLQYRIWNIKSTSKARDGLYTYDTVGRLRDAQLAASRQIAVEDLPADQEYVTLGELGEAFHADEPFVVLIDEIDKADIDFPNDLLSELDDMAFTIVETHPRMHIRSLKPPIVIITSNNERELPDAFLRRCVYHYIRFPTLEQLREIVGEHLPDVSPNVIAHATERFYILRDEMRGDKPVGKLVSTSELLDWVHVLGQFSEDEVMQLLGGLLPFAGVLLKHWSDHERYLWDETSEVT